MKSNQRGMALILALFIVVLVTVIVTSVSWRFQLSMARNENRWHGSQAEAYLEGAEQLARLVLIQDSYENQIDFLGDMWAQSGDPLPTDEGWVRGRIEDAHGRFNLNRLTAPPPRNPDDNDDEPQDRFTAEQRRFLRFLQLIELDDGGTVLDISQATEIMDAIADWLDADNNPTGFGGAERSHYESMDPPVAITNGPMTSVSELLLVKGVTPELYQKLLPYIIALPADVKMNINTVSPAILRAFNRKENLEPLQEADWKELVEERNMAEEGLQEVETFAQSPVVQSILGDKNTFDTSGLDVKSYYFLLFSETLVGEQVRRGKTLLFRNNGTVDIVRRTDANF